MPEIPEQTCTRHACDHCGRDTLEAGVLYRQNRTGKPGIWACPDHRLRIKCAIDGCGHTRAKSDDHYGYEEWMCATHWRRHCPPRSLRRRAYLAFFRKGKRRGWDESLRTKFWRFWDTLVSRANAAEKAGKIDMREINAMFGFTDE